MTLIAWQNYFHSASQLHPVHLFSILRHSLCMGVSPDCRRRDSSRNTNEISFPNLPQQYFQIMIRSGRFPTSRHCLGLVCWFALLSFGESTITVTETGRRISSRPDQFVGNRFVEGYEYMARLQFHVDQPHLCPSPSGPPLNFTVDVPPDGLPVALLVKAGGCSTHTKARVASLSIHPRHLVHYIVISDESHPGGDAYDEVEMDETLTTTSLWRRHRSSKGDNPDPSVTVGVLHVSQLAGIELQRSIASLDRHHEGGPRIILDGRNTTRSQMLRRVMMWLGISFMLLGCCLSFILSIQTQFSLSDETENGTTPAREVRRRLTLDQVDEMLPELVYTGETLVDEEHGQTSLSLQSLTGEVCSICLDEYAPQDRYSCLPCEHTFHSKCVAKWLTERSSTCPLCKTDLFVEEDEEGNNGDDYTELQDGADSDDDSERPTSSSFFSFLFTNTEARWWRRRWQASVHQADQSGGHPETSSEDGALQEPLLEQQVELSDGHAAPSTIG